GNAAPEEAEAPAPMRLVGAFPSGAPVPPGAGPPATGPPGMGPPGVAPPGPCGATGPGSAAPGAGSPDDRGAPGRTRLVGRSSSGDAAGSRTRVRSGPGAGSRESSMRSSSRAWGRDDGLTSRARDSQPRSQAGARSSRGRPSIVL